MKPPKPRHNLSRAAFHGLLLLLTMTFAFASCTTEESENVDDINKQTVVVFMPWSGSQNDNGLYRFFQMNLDSIEGAIRTTRSMSGRVVVFLSTSANASRLYEITYEGDSIRHTTLQEYSGAPYTTAEGITQILNDVQSNAFALNYAMIIGCHGTGWTYKDDWVDYPYYAKPYGSSSASRQNPFSAKIAGEGMNAIDGSPLTRFYGSVSDMGYATDVATLAQGIEGAGMKMQYILFDDCYMANVETAYELRNVTNFLIGSTSEVMAVGMPYQTMWTYLASATPNYASAVTAFNTFYKSYQYPYGALSAIDCRKLDEVANRMRGINERYALADSLVDSLQVLDGFHTPIFYDLADYVEHLCKNSDMLNDFNSALSNAIKSTANTDSIFTNLYWGEAHAFRVDRYSGITVSDPSRNSVAIKGRTKTAWWQATH